VSYYEGLRDEVRNEFDILRSLNHPNIIRIYSLVSDTNQMHLISEECKGGNMFDKLIDSDFFVENLA